MEKIFKDCVVKIGDGVFSVENSMIKRELRFDGGFFRSEYLADKRAAHKWADARRGRHDFSYRGLLTDNSGSPLKLELEKAEAKIISGDIFTGDCACLRVFLRERARGIALKREYFVFPGIAAIRTGTFVSAETLPNFYAFAEHGGDVKLKEADDVLDSFDFADGFFEGKSVSLSGRTDCINDIVSEKIFKVSGSQCVSLQGNILMLRNVSLNAGVFFALEAPPPGERRLSSGASFIIDGGDVKCLGWGIGPQEFKDGWMKLYSSSLGVFQGSFRSAPAEFKKYFAARFKMAPEKYKTMANPWGGGGERWRGRVSAEFVEKEIRASADMGLEAYQVDDGWQEFRSLSEMVGNNKPVPAADWAVRKDVFPEGFSSLQKVCAETGVSLCLWFAPAFNRAYRNWKEEAAILLDFYRKYGIKTFKIDAVAIPSKEAEDNLESLLKTLREESGGDIYFNLDTTNGMRPGFLMFQEHGNIFLENRYQSEPGLRCCMPEKTLRNIWRLAEYVPAQRIQTEFCDIEKAAEFKKNFKKTGFPENCSQEYAAAVSLFASPLCWAFPSDFSPRAKKSVSLIMDLSKKIRNALLSCVVIPVGAEPSGSSWTGFQAHNFSENSGLLIVYRENTPEKNGSVTLRHIESGEYLFTPLSGADKEFTAKLGRSAKVDIALEKINSFALYKYSRKQDSPKNGLSK